MKISQNNIHILQVYFKDKPVLRAYLFGSFARGDANSKSDYDILVELDYSKKIGLEYIQMQLDLTEILKKNVDLVTENSLSRHVKPGVEKEKLLIYERSA